MEDEKKADQLDPEDFDDESPDVESDVRLAVLCDALQEQDVTCVQVSYRGSGDEGCIESVDYEPSDDLLPDWIDRTLRDIAENYCPDGYENNDGGYGTLKVYPNLGLAELEHHDVYEGSHEMDGPPDSSLPQDLRDRLVALGIATVTALFDGFGDSGQMEEINVESESESVTLDDNLLDALENFLLEQLPSGWENNEGAFGEFIVDVCAGNVECIASWRVERSSEPQVTRWKWRK